MADGRVVIKIDADDKDLRKAEGSVKQFTASLLLAKAGEKVFDAITQSMDRAISRFDTMNQFPKIMQGIGFGAEESEKAIADLSDGIQGLPTALDEVVNTAKGFALITNDIDKAVQITLAFNNAFLASGASADEASRGLDQYSKMLSTGEVNIQSWRTLTETMGPALKDVAEQMGFTGKTATMDLYKALKDGDVTMDQFNNAMITADQAVGGFADRALEGSAGIATSMANIQTAVASGVEKVIRAFDNLLSDVLGLNIAELLNKGKDLVASTFSIVASIVEGFTPVLKGLLTVLDLLSPAIAGVTGAMAIMFTWEKLNGIIAVNNQMLKSAGFFLGLTESALDAKRVSVEKDTIAEAINSGVIGTKELLLGLVTGKLSLATVATGLYTIATNILTGALTLLNAIMNPIGLAIVAIITAGGFLLKWMFDISDATEALVEDMKEQNEASDDLLQGIEASNDAYERNQEALGSQSEYTNQLMEDTIALSEQENLSASQKKELQENVEQLNAEIEGLGLTYDEEAESLSGTNELMEARMELNDRQEAYTAGMERQKEIVQERDEIEQQLTENLNVKAEAEERLAELTGLDIVEKRKLKKEIEEVDEKNQALTATYDELGVTYAGVTADMIEDAQAFVEAQYEVSNTAIESYEQMNEGQRESYDAMNARTNEIVEETVNGWNKIETEMEMSLDDMRENLRHNNEAMEEWQELLNESAEKGISQGIIEEMEKLGPEGTQILKELNSMSASELAEFEKEYEITGTNAKDGMLDEIDMSEEDLTPGMYEMFGTAESGWEDAVNKSDISRMLPEELEKGLEVAEGAMEKSGADVVAGAIKGIESKKGDAGKASEDVGEEVDKRFSGKLGIQSPSTVFKAHGSDLIKGLEIGIKQGTPKIMTAMTKLGDDMNKAMDKAMDKLNKSSTKSLDTYVKGITKMATKMDQEMTKITRTIEKATTKMEQVMTKFETSSSKSWTKIGTTIEKATTKVERDINKTSEKIERDWKTMTTKVDSITRSGFAKMVSSMKSQLSTAERNASSTSSKVASNLRSGVSSATASGRAMGNGFRNGLNSTSGGIMNTARSIANRASNAIKSALKIKSPSRVTYGFGENFGQGFEDGIDSMMGGVDKAGQKLADSALPRVNAMKGFGRNGRGGAGMASVTNTNSQSMVVNIDTIENHTDSDIPRILEQSAWVMNRGDGRLNG